TPARGHVDSLGRALVNIAHNRFDRDGATVDVAHRTRLRLDVEGNERAVIDARDRIVMRREYDMLGRPIHKASMEAGTQWMLDDAMGKPVFAWDSRGHTIRTDHDGLRRPTKVHLRVDDGPAIVVQEMVYGEAHANPEEHNL